MTTTPHDWTPAPTNSIPPPYEPVPAPVPEASPARPAQPPETTATPAPEATATPPRSTPPESKRRRSPLVRIALLVVAALLLSAGSWFAGTLVGDKDRTELRVPAPSLLTAVVEQRVVVSTVTGRATLGFSDVAGVDAPASGGRITATPKAAGDEVAEGDVLVEVDGRPTFALVGDVPMYRPLVTGTEGPDVQALERALARLGIDPGPDDGRFDAATETAVRELFRRTGYQPVEPTAEQRAAYSAAVDAATQARLAVIEGEHALEVGLAGPDPGERAALDKAVAEADLQLAKARRDLTALQADIDAETAAAQRSVDNATSQLADIDAQLARLGDSPTDTAARAQLQATRSQVRSALDQAQTTLDGLVRGRNGRLSDALAAVAVAQDAASVARLQRTDALTDKDRSVQQQKLQVARDALAAAEQRVADQAAVVGAGLQTSEVVFFPTLPRRVQRVGAQVGEPATGRLLEVSGGDLIGRWFVTADAREQLRTGGEVSLVDSISGTRLTGTIASVATTPGDNEASSAASSADGAGGDSESAGSSPGATGGGGQRDHADEYLVTVTVTLGAGAPAAADLVDRDVLATAPVSTSAEGLAVPLAAVVSRSDGTVVVRKATGDRQAVDVVVTTGATGDGVMQVTPRDAGALAAGDRVVVGR